MSVTLLKSPFSLSLCTWQGVGGWVRNAQSHILLPSKGKRVTCLEKRDHSGGGLFLV